jgi:hypothetical protein
MNARAAASKGSAGKRALRWGVRIVATLTLSLLLLRWLYATRSGNAVIDLVPDDFWNGYHRAIGIAPGAVETVQNYDALVVLFATTLVATVLVASIERLALPRRAR